MTRKDAIIARRSVRTYTEEPIKDKQLLDLRRGTSGNIDVEAAEHLLELVGVIERVGYEDDAFPHHSTAR